MHFITRGLKVIGESDRHVLCARIQDASVAAGYPVAFRWNIGRGVRVRCVPDHVASEKQPGNFLRFGCLHPIGKESGDGDG